MKQLIKTLLPESLKKSVSSFLKKRKLEKFKAESVGLNKQKLIEGFKSAGIIEGDVLMIHSSLKSLGFVENGAEEIIDALQEVVGKNGTLVFPAFTVNGTMQETMESPENIFNASTSPVYTGAIPKTFMLRKNIFRSIHPSHSLAAWGKHAEFITKDHHKATTNFGKDTPFGKLLDLNAKLVGLGISYGPVTFYHVYEDLNPEQCSDAFLKEKIRVKYMLMDGTISQSDFLCHNPEFHKRRIDKVKDKDIEEYFSDYFEKKGMSIKRTLGNGNVWVMNTRDLITEMDILWKKNISIYSIPKEK